MISTKLVRCGDVVDVRDGTHDTPKYIENGIPLLTSKNLKNGSLDFDNVKYISIEDHEKISQRSAVDQGDILYAMIGTIGNPVIVRSDRDFSIKNVALFKLKNSPFTPEYFYYLLQSPLIDDQIYNATQGGIQKFISLTRLRNLEVPLPALEEQKRIAAIIDEQMQEVERAHQAIQAELEAAEAMSAAFLREVFESDEAQEWEECRLDDVVHIQLGKMLSKKAKQGINPQPYLRNANVQWNHFDLDQIYEMDFNEREMEKFTLRKGDVLVCEGGEPGRAAVWNQQISPMYYQKALHRLRPKNKQVMPYYIMYRLWYGGQIDEFVGTQAKTTIAHLPVVRLKEIPLRVPNLEIQSNIVLFLNEKFQAISDLVDELLERQEAVEAMPAAILRRAFSGGY